MLLQSHSYRPQSNWKLLSSVRHSWARLHSSLLAHFSQECHPAQKLVPYLMYTKDFARILAAKTSLKHKTCYFSHSPTTSATYRRYSHVFAPSDGDFALYYFPSGLFQKSNCRLHKQACITFTNRGKALRQNTQKGPLHKLPFCIIRKPPEIHSRPTAP